MSRNPNIQISTYLDTPPELLLIILSNMDHSTRINTAAAFPEVFLRPGFNVFLQDAEDQVRRQERHANPTVPLVIERSMRPLLYQAMENDVSISVIEGMLRVYTEFYPGSIDGVWGQSPTTLPPPLIHAASLGRPLIVQLLINMGANLGLRCGPHNYLGSTPADCHLAACTHANCQPLFPAAPGNPNPRTNCTTAMAAALEGSTEVLSLGPQHRDLEDCALILYRAGAPIPGGERFGPGVDPDLEQQLYYPIRARLYRLLRAVLDPLIPLRRANIGFRTVLYSGLTLAINYQQTDDYRDIIEYLIRSGAALVNPTNFLPYHHQTHAHLAARIGHTKTASYLLDQYVDQGFTLEYSGFNLRRSGDTLAFVQTLYRVMSGGGYLQFEPVSAEDLHEVLLGQAIRCQDDASVQWLVDQNVATFVILHYTIIQNNITALHAIINAGAPLNTQTTMRSKAALRFGLYSPEYANDMPEETPLNLALRLKRWEMACFLIHHGAAASLVSDRVKETLVQDFSVLYGMAYADSKPKATPAMLRPAYFGTYDADRTFDMFHYVLG